jgi:hypothetical protein
LAEEQIKDMEIDKNDPLGWKKHVKKDDLRTNVKKKKNKNKNKRKNKK